MPLVQDFEKTLAGFHAKQYVHKPLEIMNGDAKIFHVYCVDIRRCEALRWANKKQIVSILAGIIPLLKNTWTLSSLESVCHIRHKLDWRMKSKFSMSQICSLFLNQIPIFAIQMLHGDLQQCIIFKGHFNILVLPNVGIFRVLHLKCQANYKFSCHTSPLYKLLLYISNPSLGGVQAAILLANIFERKWNHEFRANVSVMIKIY